MGDSLDIQSILQSGYFTTSRARTPRPSVPPNDNISRQKLIYNSYEDEPPRPQTPPYSRYHHTVPQLHETTPKSRRKRPPPPTVEDEETSLKREHGPPSPSSSDSDLPARGDIDQLPIIMEVHEFNPERRFVMVNGPAEETQTEDGPEKQPSKPRPLREPNPLKTDPEETSTSRKYDSGLNVDRDEPSSSERQPPLERRRSRQNLPRLDTDIDEERHIEHHRTRSAVNGPRPDLLQNRQSKQFGDHLLSPDIIKSSSGGRETRYRGQGYPQSASTGHRSHSSLAEERNLGENRPRSPSYQSGHQRSSSNFEFGSRQPRRLSNDRMGDLRQRDPYVPTRTSTRDRSPPYSRYESDLSKRPSTYGSREPGSRREDSGSSDDYSGGSRFSDRRRTKSVIHQEERDSLGSLPIRKVPRGPRSKSRGPPMPVPSPVMPSFPESPSTNPRASGILPLSRAEKLQSGRGTPQLPYPDDDVVLAVDPLDPRASGDLHIKPSITMSPALSMPDATFPCPSSSVPALPPRPSNLQQAPQRPTSSQSWCPPILHPEREASRVDKPVRSPRRYSESMGTSEVTNFPDCQRKKPVVGRSDWLSLPRSDFNICPDCYDMVFATSDYRSLFQLTPRPIDVPMACDFGSSAWYRIAWLLTLKYKVSDLRLFSLISNAMANTRNYPCPGNRRAARTWLTVRNPSTRRPVYGFTICPQCAQLIETAFPNLAGVFVPLDLRSEPSTEICSMHFVEKRKRFVTYFDIMEMISDKALAARSTPDVQRLADELERLSAVSECFADRPVTDGYWHIMQYLPELTICGECFAEVVKPRLNSQDGTLARNFFMRPQRIPQATCQLYSQRMRDVFSKACRYNDPIYLEEKVKERIDVEREIHAKLASLNQSDASWADGVDRLIQRWKKWE